MIKPLLSLAAVLVLSAPAAAQGEPSRSSSEAEAQPNTPAPSPNEIVAGASASDWVTIPAEDLLVMTLAPDAGGNERKVVIQLMPAPFSQGWVANIRTLARANWYDDISVNRVQDNYVVQWGDPNYDNPEATGETKELPGGLKVMDESEFTARVGEKEARYVWSQFGKIPTGQLSKPMPIMIAKEGDTLPSRYWDSYSFLVSFFGGFPLAIETPEFGQDTSKPASLRAWPVHCYGMVGVGRNYSPDTGSGAELYTVIGHAPRHLDRNIALVGRVIEGMEHLSSLPRGKGDLGFYAEDEFDKRTPILTVRVASDLPEAEQPAFEYLNTDGTTFERYVDARANRRDPFFIVPAGGADICNIPVPVRAVED